MCRSARSRRACVRFVPEVDRRRGPPTKPLLASTPLRGVERSRPLPQALLRKREVFLIRSARQSAQVPAAEVRAPHHHQVHALARAKAQTLYRPKYAVFVLGFHQSHDHNRSTRGVSATARGGIGRGGADQSPLGLALPRRARGPDTGPYRRPAARAPSSVPRRNQLPLPPRGRRFSTSVVSTLLLASTATPTIMNSSGSLPVFSNECTSLSWIGTASPA